MEGKKPEKIQVGVKMQKEDIRKQMEGSHQKRKGNIRVEEQNKKKEQSRTRKKKNNQTI